jgi:hypothetical protein
MPRIIFILTVLCFALHFSCTGQSSVGIAGLYNLQTESIGVGARWEMRGDKRLQIVPQFSYFLPSNKVNEWTLGMALQYKVVKLSNFNVYGLAHLGYNNWINFQESKMKGAQKSNWNGELGAGVQLGKRFKPFFEWRYNVHFQEAHVQAGILIRIKKGSAKKEKCAAYN